MEGGLSSLGDAVKMLVTFLILVEAVIWLTTAATRVMANALALKTEVIKNNHRIARFLSGLV